jgi:hypothetical protein
MDPLIFTLHSEVTGDQGCSLIPYPQCDISEVMWEELAAKIAEVNNLDPYPASILAGRFHEGYAAVTVYNGHIISYLNLSPIVQHMPGAHSWEVVTAALDVAPFALPMTDVYEFTSSWTDPAWRGKRIGVAMHPPLLERHLKGNTLMLSVMVGLASPILARLGWQIIAWDTIPFVSSLAAVPSREFPAQAAAGWEMPKGYQGPHIPLDHPTHRWDQFCYCWVSSPDIALRLEQELADRMHGDIARWRSAVVSAFTQPESLHILSYLS